MSDALSSAELEQYRQNGYLFPLNIFDVGQVKVAQEALQQARDDAIAKGLESDWPMYVRTNTHLLMPFVHQMASDEALLDKVESVLGPNILLWSAEFFIKPAQTDKIVSWHQDLTYWGLGETDEELTAWVALSDVNEASGCMRFVPGSHKQRILPHRDTFADDNLLSRGQEVAVDIDEDEAVDVVLAPGQVSFHHGRIFHASGPNQSAADRVGLAIRYITPGVRQLVAERDYAMTVRGRDNSGNWIEVSPPKQNFDADALALYARVRADQNVALAEGIEPEQMHSAY